MNRTQPRYLGLKLVIDNDSLLNIGLNMEGWNDYDVIIEWGDGTSNVYNAPGTSTASYNYVHTYSEQGTYYVKIYSTSNVIPAIFKGIRGNDNNYNWNTLIRRCITEVYNATIAFEDCSNWNFRYCPNLKKIDWQLLRYCTTLNSSDYFLGTPIEGEVPYSVFCHLKGNTGRMFNGLSGLTGSPPDIPEGVTNTEWAFCNTSFNSFPYFSATVTNINNSCRGMTVPSTLGRLPNGITNMSTAFYECTNLSYVTNIPTSCTNMYCTFYSCYNLNQIPTLPNTVENMRQTFSYTALPSVPSIPTACTTLEGCFQGCGEMFGDITQLSIPSGCTNLNYTFMDCQNLSGSTPTLPSTCSLYMTFYGCSGLDGSITNLPTTLPSSNTYMEQTFYCCSSLTGSIPTLPSNVTRMDECFCECSGLTGSIPTIPNTVSNLTATFYGCSGLTGSTPAISGSVGGMARCFYECTGLDGTIGAIDTSIAADFTETFYGCSNLTGNAPALWDSSVYPNITQPEPGNSNGCFYGCTSLSNYNDIPADWK